MEKSFQDICNIINAITNDAEGKEQKKKSRLI